MSILGQEINTLPKAVIRRFLKIYSFLIAHGDNLSRFYVAFVLIALFTYMATMPIHFTDTDMWYHLNGGRYFWENFSVPNSSFFSFIEPTREWTNYFWGFQAITYGIHHLFGWTGLILFKAILVTATGGFIYRILVANNENGYATTVQLVLFSLIILILLARFNAVRPHLISYFFITFFIYTLYYRTKYIRVLPFLAIIWINTHGVEWVVGALICTPFLISRISSYFSHKDMKNLSEIVWVSACLPALLINPFGPEMLLAPLKTPVEAYLFITELKQPDLSFYTNFSFNDFLINRQAAAVLLFLLSIVGLTALWARGKLKLEHIIFTLAGVFLLFRGIRFLWEWVLLCMPVFQSASLLFSTPAFGNRKIITPIITIILLAALPGYIVKNTSFERYPYDTRLLPEGTTNFIKSLQTKGTYLFPPVYGGYIQWELYPDVLIHSDMEFPPFDGETFYELQFSLAHEDGVKRIVRKYNPDFLAAEISHENFRHITKNESTYIPVHFDDSLVLYANTEKHPEIAKKYGLESLNPHDPSISNIQNKVLAISELRRALTFEPNPESALVAVTKLLLESGQLEEAKKYSTKLMLQYPKTANAHILSGLIEIENDNCAIAIEHFVQALEFSGKKHHRTINLNLGNCYYLTKQFELSYSHFKLAFNQYRNLEKLEHFYQYAFSSLVIGKTEKAEVLLKQLLMHRNDDNKQKIFVNAKKLLNQIQNKDLDIGVL
jgi:tetratricopeptide (TPR) repeat protein